MKRIAVISDLHCGHRTGLTPPQWHTRKEKWGEVQSRLWDWFSGSMEKLGHFDALIVNGDAIDGKGERSGGTELLTTDREEQTEMAFRCIESVSADKVYIISGTPYHAGRDEDWESVLATRLDAQYGAHEWIQVDGVTFDVRHKVGGSVIPHGRYTAIQRAKLWNTIWSSRGIQPGADIILRSHVHFYGFSGGADGMAMTTPALQAWTKYGSKECEGTNDIGFITFDVDGRDYQWQAHLFGMDWAAVKPWKV